MQFARLFADDDAVSPVIGVILMVAITVILAAVIGAFVLGFGGGGPAAPQVSWDVSQNASNADTVDFTHDGGAAISEPTTVLSAGGAADDLQLQLGTSAPVQAGGTLLLINTSGGSPNAYSPGETIQIVWSPDGSSDSQIIGEHDYT